jgi:hypothetical protein
MSEVPRFLSWGCGLQSTVIGEMSACGDLPKCTIIHADTGWERQATIEIREFYADRWRKAGLDVHIIGGLDIRAQGALEHVHMPFWTDTGAPMRRQCTRHFKLTPIKRLVRECLGFDTNKPPHPKPGSAIIWLGITVDEWVRAKPSRIKFMENRYPLLVARMHRADCADWLQSRDLPVPIKSACVGCPYRRASEWIDMRDNAPGEWKKAVEFDMLHRNNPLAERGASTADELYLYREAVPLSEANLEADAKHERQHYGTQLPMFACESGFCGV